MTLQHPKMHIHTKFGIPTSKNIRDMLQTQQFLKLGQRSRSQRPKMVCDTPSSQDAFTHQIWNSYLKEYVRYAPDLMQYLVNIKVTVTQLWYATLYHPKVHHHTNFEIPTSNNIGDMLRT